VAATVYLPSVLSGAMIASQIAWLLRAPARYLRCMAMVMRGRYRYDNGPSLWLHGIVDFARGAHLARLVARDREFCHLHAQFADDACTTTLVASMLATIPFSFRSHTSPNPQLIREKVRQAQFVVSASLYDKRVLVHWCGERAGRKIQVNHLGVPLDRYAPPSAGEPLTQAGITSPPRASRPLILSVGTLCAKKGFEYLIRACRILADRGVPFDCLIVGDGSDRGRLEELVEELELGKHLTLAPYRPQEEIRRLFQEAAVFALPCIFPLDGNVDVIPLVLQEAMAMEQPVVSTPISGIPELIQHGNNGLLVPEKDHEALAAALEALLADTELSRRLGVAGRETVRSHFDVAANGRALAEIFRCEVPALEDVQERALGVGPSKQKASPYVSAPTPDARHPTPGRHDLGR
jgi:glycosyltransferase involved in cell wall biosynthesis